MDSWVIMMPRERILVDCLSLSDTVSVHRISNWLRFASLRTFLINFSITWHYTFSLLRNDCNIHAPVHFKGCNYEIVHAQRLFFLSILSICQQLKTVKPLHFATGGQYATAGLWSVSSGQCIWPMMSRMMGCQLDGSLSVMAKIWQEEFNTCQWQEGKLNSKEIHKA